MKPAKRENPALKALQNRLSAGGLQKPPAASESGTTTTQAAIAPANLTEPSATNDSAAPQTLVRSLTGGERYADHLGRIVMVPVEDLQIEDNVRRHLETQDDRFEELVASIQERGLLQNLVAEVRRIGAAEEQLTVVSGQRRLIACRRAGITSVPVLLKEYVDMADRVADGLVENLCRSDLTAVDVAEGYAQLIRHGWHKDQIAERFDRGRRTIEKYLQIAAWPEEARRLIREYNQVFTTDVLFNQFPAAVTSIPEVLLAKMNVMIREAQGREDDGGADGDRVTSEVAPSGKSTLDPYLQSTADQLHAKLRSPVKISGSQDRCRVTLRFTSAEAFARFRELMGIVD